MEFASTIIIHRSLELMQPFLPHMFHEDIFYPVGGGRVVKNMKIVVFVWLLLISVYVTYCINHSTISA